MSRRGSKSNKKYIYLGILALIFIWIFIASQKVVIKPEIKEEKINISQ